MQANAAGRSSGQDFQDRCGHAWQRRGGKQWERKLRRRWARRNQFHGSKQRDNSDLSPVTGQTALWTHISYLFMAMGFLFPPLALIGAVIAFRHRDDGRGTVLEGHHTWIIQTFWIALAVGAMGNLLTFLLVGFPVLFALSIWYAWRIAKGWLMLFSARQINYPYAFL